MTLLQALRAPLALSALLVFLPAVISDYFYFKSLNYNSTAIYLLARLICWLLLPSLALALLLRGGENQRRAALVAGYLTCAIVAYQTASLGQGIFSGVLFAVGIFFAWDAFVSTAFLLLAAAIAVLAYVGTLVSQVYSHVATQPLQSYERTPNKQATLPQFKLSQSVYLIVFDELARTVLYDGEEVDQRYPNFRKLAAESLSPPAGYTNFDSSELVIPLLLSGIEPDSNAGFFENMAFPGLFDAAIKNPILVWGSIQPYCKALQLKRIETKLCQDENTLLEQRSSLEQFVYVTKLEVMRIARIYLLSPPALALLNASQVFEDLLGESRSRRLQSRLKASIAAADLATWMRFAEHDLERHNNFLKHIGTEDNAFYYFHSYTPHAPYFLTRELEIITDTSFMCYHCIPEATFIPDVDRRYQENVEAADTLLGRIIDAIDSRDPDAIVIVTSDHGIARSPEKLVVRPTGLLNLDIAAVPLFIRLPKSTNIPTHQLSVYQHLDFVPTFYDILGIPLDEQKKGISAFDERASDYFFVSKGQRYTSYPID